MADIDKTKFKLKYSEQFGLSGLEKADINLQLNQVDNIDSSVYGTVTDGENPVADATVKLFDSEGVPFNHTLTDVNGNYSMDGDLQEPIQLVQLKMVVYFLTLSV